MSISSRPCSELCIFPVFYSYDRVYEPERAQELPIASLIFSQNE